MAPNAGAGGAGTTTDTENATHLLNSPSFPAGASSTPREIRSHPCFHSKRKVSTAGKCKVTKKRRSIVGYFRRPLTPFLLGLRWGRLIAQCHLHCDTKCGRTGASPSMTLEVCSIRTGRETRLVWGCVGENRKRWAFFIQGAAKRSGIGFECGD